ncbi:retron system putative HNH endonuclease [Paraglaciecola aestuariivivens]
MKQITKRNEPQELLDWKALENDDWKPSFDNLQGNEKRAVRNSLLAEQGYICCYCNKDIGDDDFHIEHFRPQETFEALELDYNNLHASCLKNQEARGPFHCGMAKGNWFDNALTLSPLANHESSFNFLYNGLVEPTVQNAAQMVERLKLNDASLAAKRKAEIAGILDAYFIETATEEQLINLFRKIGRLVNGRYQPFVLAIQQQIKQLLPQNIVANL